MDSPESSIRQTLDQVKGLLSQETPPKLSEADTKANFIEPLIAALGWHGIGIVTREYYVRNSQEFIDYMLSDGGRPILAIEAKPLQTALSDKAAAQLIQYCSVDGIEWAALTNGRELQFFNTFLRPDLEAKRVLRLDLLAYNTDDEFEVLFNQIRQLSRESMTTPAGVRTWLNQRRMDETLRSVLLDQTSPAIRVLRRVLSEAEIKATPQEITNWVRNQLHAGPNIAPVVSTNSAKVGTVLDLLATKPRGEVVEEGGGTSTRDFDPLTSHVFEGKHQALLDVFEPLAEKINERLPGTEWRSMKRYVAAEDQGSTFLSIKRRANALVLGLALPSDVHDQRLIVDPSIFRWARITKACSVSAIAEIDNYLVDLIAQAHAHALSAPVGGKAHFGVSLSTLISAGIVQPDEKLQLMKDNIPIAEGVLNDIGHIEYNGAEFTSPSDRVFARLMGRQSLNGWTAWSVVRPEGSIALAALRDVYLARVTDRETHDG